MNKINHKKLTAYAKKTRFQPFIRYDQNDGHLEFLISDEDYIANKLSQHITIYRSRKNRKIVGGFIEIERDEPSSYTLDSEEKTSPRYIYCLLKKFCEKELKSAKSEIRVCRGDLDQINAVVISDKFDSMDILSRQKRLWTFLRKHMTATARQKCHILIRGTNEVKFQNNRI